MFRSLGAAIAGATTGRDSVRIATYNVLSPSLAAPSWFVHCDPKALDPSARFDRITALLETEVANDAIISLQEVSLKWVGPLQVWFAKREYRFVQTNYGGAFNGFMGVGIAYPTRKYSLLDLDLCRMSDTKRWPKQPEEGGGIGRAVLGLLTPIGRLAWSPVYFARRALLGAPKSKEDPWDYSMRRFNQAVSMRLQSKDTSATFWISTYHMPCAFFLPPAMVIHTALAVQNVSSLASKTKDPYILVGDFNIKPGEGSYDLIVKGSIPSDHPELPRQREWDSWQPTVPNAMKSAYLEVNGAEPNFTNYAQTKNDDKPFIDCLDYIFYSQECTAKEIRKLPHRDAVKGPFPTAEEPSDHMLLAATIEVPCRREN